MSAFFEKKSLLIVTIVMAFIGYDARAQLKVGNNPTVINPNSILEMESNNKGMLLPRINLIATNNPAPLTSFVEGMFVYNLATANDVIPGTYYCDGTKWVKMASAATASAGILKLEYTASQGQVNFITPATITDIQKISLYRNGVLINCTVVNANTIASEISCVANDNVKIIQHL